MSSTAYSIVFFFKKKKLIWLLKQQHCRLKTKDSPEATSKKDK